MEKYKNMWIKSHMDNKLKRANLLIVDEFRMVDFQVISKVLRKFLTAPRSPKYLEKDEYAHLKERNKEVYLSSCWYKSHWSYNRFLAYYNSMMKSSKYFVCGLPYQLAIKEGLLDEEQVKDEMSEEDFDEIGYSMEMEALWFGESEKAFFKFDDLEKNRKLASPLFPPDHYDLIKDASFKYEPKKAGEIRLISCDIAAMAGKDNDASVYTILRLMPTNKGYDRYLSYMESMVGGNTVTQAVRIRQLYDDFDCDYIVLDTQNIGLGIYDQLTQPLFDKERSKEYDPISCINDDAMAERCAYSNAEKIIYSIKASAKLNSEIAFLFRDGFKRGKIRLPINEIEGREHMRKYKSYENLPEETKAMFMSSYAQFTLLVNEMINLEAEYNDSNQVKLKEPNGKRKDRYSSASYGNYIATLLERKLSNVEEYDVDEDDLVYF